MRIAIGSDHAGFNFKERIKPLLIELGHTVQDFGTHSTEPVDYPVFVRPVAIAVAAREFDRGIVLGGSGNGEAMAANRVPGVRCAVCWNVETAWLAREHNDSNVLSLGERVVTWTLVPDIVKVWLTTEFAGGRHLRRIAQLDDPIPRAKGD
jgi:ribose 5-phosphate isomerase B